MSSRFFANTLIVMVSGSAKDSIIRRNINQLRQHLPVPRVRAMSASRLARKKPVNLPHDPLGSRFIEAPRYFRSLSVPWYS